MKDTDPVVNETLFRGMMNRSEGERLLMGMDLQATARALVWATIPKDLPEPDRKRQFYERFFGESCPW